MGVRVRYAPSPTGRQHVGNVRTALFDYLLARSTGGTFVLRIEDTDRRRFDPDALQDVYDTLSWLGLQWDEGPGVGGPHAPYVQSQRVDRHRAVAERLVAAGHAYRCYCDAARLERVRAAGNGYDRHCRNLTPAEHAAQAHRGAASVIRFKVPLEGTTRYDDLLLGSIERRNSDINPDPVLLKSDGFPTYHLAAIADDHEMRISHALRSQEWVSSAPLHLLIFQACGWQPPRYAHLPAVNGPDGKKLAKRHGATGIHEFRRRGFLPEALVNYLALLGWSPGDDRELFRLEELERAFSLERLGRAGAVFDHRKLEWFNGQHIRMLSPRRLAAAVAPYLQAAGIEVADDGQAVALVVQRPAHPYVIAAAWRRPWRPTCRRRVSKWRTTGRRWPSRSCCASVSRCSTRCPSGRRFSAPTARRRLRSWPPGACSRRRRRRCCAPRRHCCKSCRKKLTITCWRSGCGSWPRPRV